jgi:FkbM family methyltransferase
MNATVPTLMSSEILNDGQMLVDTLARAGHDAQMRGFVFEALREMELRADDPATFREQVRWPLILLLLRDVKTHRVVLDNGAMFDVSPDSRIEKSLLLSTVAHPDHVWEPQTTRLLVRLAAKASNVIVGGAYIGDQVVLMARKTAGTIHAFEPMAHAFDRLVHHTKINELQNVAAHQLCLWNTGNQKLRLDGHLALASSVAFENDEAAIGETVPSTSIDSYVQAQALSAVELIMLDTEGGEENAMLQILFLKFTAILSTGRMDWRTLRSLRFSRHRATTCLQYATSTTTIRWRMRQWRLFPFPKSILKVRRTALTFWRPGMRVSWNDSGSMLSGT